MPDLQKPLRGGELTAAISNMVIRLLADYTGRGPTRARTSIRDDLVVVLLEDQLTKGERTLVAKGHTAKVMDIRTTFQLTMRDEAVTAVERLTGRSVVAYMSANHAEPDVAVELFLLERSRDGDGGGDGDASQASRDGAGAGT